MSEHRYVTRYTPLKVLDTNLYRQLSIKDINLPESSGIIEGWTWYLISQNTNIQEVRNNPNKAWNKFGLSKNIQLTVKDVDTLKLPNSIRNWDWNDITPHINIQEIINNPNKPWNRNNLKCNRGCTEKILEFFDSGLLKHLQKNIPQFKYHTDIVVKC